MSHYDTLEVSPKASPEVIRAAYKSLMQRFHPDKHPGNSAVAQRAGLITLAYDTLADPSKRRAYDRSRKAAEQADSPAPRGLSKHRHRSPTTRSATATRPNNAVAFFWGIVLVILVAGGGSLWLLKANSARKTQAVPVTQATAGAHGVASAQTIKRATLTVRLGTDLQVLVGASGIDSARPYTLKIPALDVRIGSTDADEFARYLGQQRWALQASLIERLALMQPDELIKASGQQYLGKLILEALIDITGTDAARLSASPHSNADAADGAAARYGVIGVAMPDGFTLK